MSFDPEDFEGKDYDEEPTSRIILFLYKFRFIFLGIVVLMFGIIAFVVIKSNSSEVFINSPEALNLYVNEYGQIDVKFSGVEKIKNTKMKTSIDNTSIVELSETKFKGNSVSLSLNPIMSGKTVLNISYGKSKRLSKKVNLLVCKKLSIDNFSSDEIYIKPGSSSQILFDSGEAKECKDNVKFESYNQSIVKTDNNVISVLKEGKTKIKIKQNDDNEFDLNIISSNNIELIKKINIKNEKNELSLNETKKINYVIEPSNSNNKYLIWESSDEKIVKVTQMGEVTAVGYGEATVTIRSIDGSNVKATLKLIVKKNGETAESLNVKNIKLKTNNLDIKQGDTFKIEYDIEPENSIYDSISFKSSNENVLVVDDNGIIKALKPGTSNVEIVLINKDSSVVKSNLKITVKNGTSTETQKKVTSITVKKKDLTIEKGKTTTIQYEIAPKNATYKSISFKSSNVNVVVVDDSGVIKAVKSGTANIEVKITNNDSSIVKSTVKVTVKDGTVPKTQKKVTNITLKKSSVTINKGKTETIQYEITPKDSVYKSISFKSSNESVATVDKNGIIKAVKSGTANIEVKITNNDSSTVKSTVKVTVKEIIKAASVKIDDNYAIDYDIKYKINYTISPSNAEVSSITFKSSNKDGLDVSSDGYMTLKKDGTYTVYVIVNNKDGSTVQASKTVTLNPSVKTYSEAVKDVSTDSATISALIANIYNKQLTEFGIYLWESSASQPGSPTYKTTSVSSSTKSMQISTKTMNKTLKAGTTYKYRMYLKVGQRTYMNDVKQFSTLAIKSLSFSRSYAAVQVGSSYKLPIKIDPTNITPTYKSSNTSIATVDSSGNIRGVKTGETTVTATYAGKSANIKVRVVGAVSRSSPAVVYDLSEYNTVSSWFKMKSSGINYLILRLGITSTFNYTDTRVDKSFNSYVTNARNNDIEIGVYYYSKANSLSAVQNEAYFVLNTLKSYPKGTFSLPVYIDYGESQFPFNLNSANYIKRFCEIIESGGYYCGAYTYYYMFNNYDLGSSVKARWVPDWTCSARYKDSVSNLGMWQYSVDDSSACYHQTVYGVNFADINYMYIDYSSTIINSGYNNF